jgi:hypothetical protein
VEYNRKHSYNPLTDNCQTFFQELLKRLSISREFKGELKKVIDKLMSKGEIIDFFYKDKIFKTRKDLDDFLEEIKFDSLCQDDKILLLSYRNTYNLFLKTAKKNADEEGMKKYETTDEAEKKWNEYIKKYYRK